MGFRSYLQTLTQSTVYTGSNVNKDRTPIILPSIVTDSLVLHLDAGNSSSYPGSGTTWTDLVAPQTNATLVNSVTYSSINGGYLIFNGTTQYANFASSVLTSSETAVSFFMWLYPKSDGVALSVLDTSTINTSYHHSSIEIGSSGQLRMGLWNGSSVSNVSSTLTFNTWNNVGFTYSETTLTGYLNGSSIGTTSFTWSKPTNIFFGIMATDDTTIGGTSAYGDGNVSTFYVYNKALNSTEVAQNYNALKGRFGL